MPKGMASRHGSDSQRRHVRLDCADDGLHANGNLTVSDGFFAIASGDDGIHADAAVVVASGAIDISQSYEGIEGLSIDITGGTVQLTASDDGLNAAGGNDSSGFQAGADAFARDRGARISPFPRDGAHQRVGRWD